MTFDDFHPGDKLWIINSRANGTYEAEVVAIVNGHALGVKPTGKKDSPVLFFNIHTGAAMAEHSHATLARPQDWRVKVISERKEHVRRHQEVMKAVKAFYEEPVAENGYALTDAVEAWRMAAVLSDPVAIVSESVEDYVNAKELVS